MLLAVPHDNKQTPGSGNTFIQSEDHMELEALILTDGDNELYLSSLDKNQYPNLVPRYLAEITVINNEFESSWYLLDRQIAQQMRDWLNELLD